MRIDGSAALVTGASQGLGRALARALARGGASVALVARGREALDSAVEEIRSLGGEAYGIADDVGDPRAGYRIAAQAASLAGPIDLLINAASTLGETPLPVLLDARAEDVEQVFQVNLLGPFRLIKATAGQMALRGGGLVLNVSSDAAVEAYPGWGAYGASKAALDVFARLAGIHLDLSDLDQQAEAVNQHLLELVERMRKAAREESAADDEEFPVAETASGTDDDDAPDLDDATARHIETLFAAAENDRSRAFRLKEELDRLGAFDRYKDRFLDLFRKGE